MRFERLTAIFVLLLIPPCVSFAQDISVSTDKTVYLSGEKIKITVKNISSRSIFSTAASSTPEFSISNVERKLSQWSWDAFRLHCGWPDCDIEFDQPGEIKPGQSAVFEWLPRIYSGKRYIPPRRGSWRMTSIYQVRKDSGSREWVWKTVKSNEFTLQ